MKKKKTRKKDILIAEIKKNKVSFAVYITLRVIAIVLLVLSILFGNYESAGMCLLTLIMLLAPPFVEKTFKVDLPTTLEVVVMCFIFAHTILGELASFYVRVPGWDTMLHTLNGFICVGVGMSLVDLLNRNKKFRFELSPIYVVLAAFCFSMTVGVMWEFFEFGMDMFLGTDMQKDTVITSIKSVMLDPTNSNKVITVNGIQMTEVNGELLPINGYLDIGLIDTMKDLFVNFIGAVIFSIGGFFYLKFRGKKSRVIEGFIPTPVSDDKTEE
jgi:hypothetical protein